MDNFKVQNTQFSNLKCQSSVISFLDNKLEKASVTTQDNSQRTRKNKNKSRNVIPDYRFQFGEYKIGESVEYQVMLIETFKVFRRTITEKFKFRTQYSKLEKLSQKLGIKGFPQKKWFGNKSPQFIQKRKKQLEVYLNKVAKTKSSQFLQFILQVKQANFIQDMKKPFKLPN